MKITAIKIEKLFDIFDYDISLTNPENLLIITGPNGFGKTMILNIISSLFNRKFLFFYKLAFEKIILKLEDNRSIKIHKKIKNEKPSLQFIFFQDKHEIDRFEYSEEIEIEIEKIIKKYLPVKRISEKKWIDDRTENTLSIDDIINELDQLSEDVEEFLFHIKSTVVNQILDSIKVHLIKEQRLFKIIQINARSYPEEKNQTFMTDTIRTYENDLKKLISKNLQQSFKISQELDSTYPDRLIKEKNKLTEEEYNHRFEKLKIKQEKLSRYGLYESNRQLLGYNQDDAKALLVYLNDLEKKLEVFDNLLEKLELFTEILNQRRFIFKKIRIDIDKGFIFKTDNGKELNSTQLSSGEQHEVVLLYELIFLAKPGVLVLIDEPEISLHVTWQKEFINDLLKIIKIQNIQVLIATHSPSIINDRWDLVYNLEKAD